MSDTCPFRKPDQQRIWFDDEIAFVLWDTFPITKSHPLVIPKQHAESLYDFPEETQDALWKLVAEVRSRLMGLSRQTRVPFQGRRST